MHLHSYRIKNYRRLRDVHIELASDISIFVGSNNSGKTSATQAISAFVSGVKDKFSLYDFQLDLLEEVRRTRRASRGWRGHTCKAGTTLDKLGSLVRSIGKRPLLVDSVVTKFKVGWYTGRYPD